MKLSDSRIARFGIAVLCLCVVREPTRASGQTTPGVRPDSGERQKHLAEQPGNRHKSHAAGDRDAKKILKHYPEADKNGDRILSDQEIREYVAEHPLALSELKMRKHPELVMDHDGQWSKREWKANRDKREAKEAKKSQTRPADADTDVRWTETQKPAKKQKQEGHSAQASSGQTDERKKESDGAKRARKEAKRQARDPWVHYVDTFCDRYQLDAEQRATAQSILREFVERRANLSQQQSPLGTVETTHTNSVTRMGTTRLDRLFNEFKQLLERIPTASQRAATQPTLTGTSGR